MNVEQRGVEFVPGTGRSPRAVQTQENKEKQAQGTENTANTNKEQRRNTWTNADGSIRPISKWPIFGPGTSVSKAACQILEILLGE